jgi:soluble lytic murein transglycosylase
MTNEFQRTLMSNSHPSIAVGATGRLRRRWRRAIAAFLLGSSLLASAPSVAVEPLTPDELEQLRQAIYAARLGDWGQAHGMASGVGDPAALKLAYWYLVVYAESTVGGFSELAGFVGANPHWPESRLLRRRVEESIGLGASESDVVAWFERFPPVSDTGRVRYAEALRLIGREDEAVALARQTWIDSADLPPAESTALLLNFGDALGPDEHRQRLDRLLWHGRVSDALRMLDLVDSQAQTLARARLDLRRGKATPRGVLAKLPPAAADDPGLRYEMVRWYRKNDQEVEARRLLAGISSADPQAERWWDERMALARGALSDFAFDEAYEIVRAHGLTGGSDFVDAEWMAGWIALRFVNDPRAALEHFRHLHDNVRYAVSIARGAYWAGRATAAMARDQDAEDWYRRAARHPSVFYGQLAHAVHAPGQGIALPPEPPVSAEARRAFENDELVRAARMLAQIYEPEAVRKFLLHLVDLNDQPQRRQLVAAFAEQLGYPEFAVGVARRAIRDGHVLAASGYPVIALPRPLDEEIYPIEDALVLAVIRQESAFDGNAVSSAGARGLMQLMPATARAVASKLNIAYEPGELMGDSDYNLRLGQAYLGSMIDRFGGSYVLALAAYNAGPGRASRWLDENGDPRRGVDEAVDWIERIPFTETRNYVQRILENLQIYRFRLSGRPPAQTIADDLVR